ncbi:Proteinase inhibitor I13 [Macleaya cordata]|uniref:Proteinase inhibitor I13 n=1 Tax=Macleaya cordata TaxID=56857 RepID=A0A200R6Q2_MACCD|nr:Proteinase inhibitor I13 [Macleaya cordata]
MVYPPCKSVGCDIPKYSWPELVGKPGAQAKAIIEREAPGVTAMIIAKDKPRTLDFCCNRVWVNVNHDAQRTVAWAPKIG